MAAAIPALGALFAGGGAAAGAGAVAGGLSASSILSGGLTAFSALSSIRGGQAASASLKGQAASEEFRGRQEVLRGEQRANEITADLLDTVASQRAGFAANGIDTGSSVARVAESQSVKESGRQIRRARSNAAIAAGGKRGQARRLLLDADEAEIAGGFQAIGTIGNFFQKRLNRGKAPKGKSGG